MQHAMGWDDLRVLLAIQRGGSFLAAGEALGVSTSTVARRIATLERAQGRTLVHRTSQGTHVDADLDDVLALARRFEVDLAARQRDAAAPFAGVVKVSVPDGLAATVAVAAVRFAQKHPQVAVEVQSELRFVDLGAREADIGVRNRPSSSPVLIDRPLGEVVSGLFGSAQYLERRLPRRFLGAGDYEGQDFVIDDDTTRAPAHWVVDRGARRFSFRSNAYDARIAAARGGLGLTIAALVDQERYPDLHEVVLETPLPRIPFFLTMHAELRRVPRVRAFAAALVDTIADVRERQDRLLLARPASAPA